MAIFTTKQSINLLILNSPTIHKLEKLKYIKGNKLKPKKYEFGIKTYLEVHKCDYVATLHFVEGK